MAVAITDTESERSSTAADAPGRGASIRRAARRVPRGVWLATLLFSIVTALWTVAVPAFRAPDEAAHVDLVMYLAEGNGYPSYDGRYVGEAIGLDSDRHLIDRKLPWPRFDAREAPSRGDRPDVDGLGGTTPDADARRRVEARAGYPYVYNQMPQHPPLYYLVMATLLRTERAGRGEQASFSAEIGILRLANVLLVAPLPLLAWATVVRLGAGDRAGVVASLLPLGVPQLSHIAAAVNNDNLLTLAGGLLAVLLAGVARGRRSRRTDLAVGGVLGLALLTKAFAVMFAPWVLAAYGLCAWTTRSRRTSAQAAATAGITSAAVGGWWWIANWMREGEPAPTTETLTRTSAQRPPGFEPDPTAFIGTFVGRLVSRTAAWVGHGTPKFELSPVVVGLLSLAVIVAVIVAGRTAAGGRSSTVGLRTVDVLVGLLPAVLISLFVARRAWGLYETNGRFAFIQGRYLFSTFVSAAAIIAIGISRLASRWAIRTVLLVAVGLQGWLLREVVRGSWTGPGAVGPIRGALAWSPWPPAVVFVACAIAIGSAGALALMAEPGPEPGAETRLGPTGTGPVTAPDIRGSSGRSARPRPVTEGQSHAGRRQPHVTGGQSDPLGQAADRIDTAGHQGGTDDDTRSQREPGQPPPAGRA